MSNLILDKIQNYLNNQRQAVELTDIGTVYVRKLPVQYHVKLDDLIFASMKERNFAQDKDGGLLYHVKPTVSRKLLVQFGVVDENNLPVFIDEKQLDLLPTDLLNLLAQKVSDFNEGNDFSDKSIEQVAKN
ncbi:hypothetical protein [Alysiella crassa]|uniref:Uncharacterized protein n=1 Tax=Alysiella crassa TaxID=153491 RepID=A0A376BVT1_9NEIS|nr:hypothetical protein [Alysiella crassa]UOP06517.1 hypothetical protein LVJ80_12275 [Alysiella crassa]SSY81050.1 Uncharacterised protein [Alysiella crassa]